MVSVQYTTTVLEDNTIAFRPTGGIRGEESSGGMSSLVRTVSYFGGPSPKSLFALKLITYSEFASEKYRFYYFYLNSLITSCFVYRKLFSPGLSIKPDLIN